MRIAFYAPMKPPDHLVPSGDRQMARLLVAALKAGGHQVTLASQFRSFLPAPHPDLMDEVERIADAEAAAIAATWGRADDRPDLWFTYHSYYKAPDLLGPRLAQSFALPYASAEASHAPKRRQGPWNRWHDANEAAIRAGAVHFCFTAADRAGLEEVAGPGVRLVELPPFIDASRFAAAKPGRQEGPAELVSVAMMRPGAKSRSYRFLAEALARLPAMTIWRLTIVGDGAAREAVLAMFAGFPDERIAWLGELDQAGIGAALGNSDVFVWPGYDEAYGISYLEASAAGLPVLAMRAGGVPSVVRDRVTGILTREGDLDGFSTALAELIEDGAARDRLGKAGRRFVLEERNVDRAAAILSHGLASALGGASPRKRQPA